MASTQKILKRLLLISAATGCISSINATKLNSVSVVDQNYLMIHFLDGEVCRRDDGKGEKAFTNSYHEDDADTVKRYTPVLSTTAAQQTSSWTIKSDDDASYGTAGVKPDSCFRKTKMNGHAEKAWSMSLNDYTYDYTYEHFIFLKLPSPMQQGKKYTVEINSAVNSDVASKTVTFDIFNSISEAVHVNLVGYPASTVMKSADLYIWMGSGGARDYSSFVGKKVYVYNTKTNQSSEAGTVSLWKKSGDDVGWYNLFRSTVWNADFSAFNTAGTYRLAIEGVGCSQEFTITDTIYHDPCMVSVQGFFYMRIGQDSTGGIWPVPRRPLYIPEESPVSTKVYLTTMQPYHSEWSTFSSGDVWDQPNDWAKYKKTGSPTNKNAKGGHSDALDWDRNLGHISDIWDLLLPFILTKGAVNDDNFDIAESGNKIPDIIDEARNEVDFWLNLRDGAGYAHGLTNPNDKNEFFQAGPTAIAAWANAVNASMLAECFRINGNTTLMNQYRDSAVIAFSYADKLTDKQLDKSTGIGDQTIRGKDLRMTAAAYLYNVTSETKYEDIFNQECVATTTTSVLEDNDSNAPLDQLYGIAAYLTTPQTVHYQALFNNMKASVIYQAKQREANYCNSRPSRRSTNDKTGYFRTAQNVHHTLIAHYICDNATDKALFYKALLLEADYGLGRNPLNMIQMTTATTPLENKRSVINAYTTGGDDGAPGLHPGHTPYFNLDDWATGMTMGTPSKLYENCYPANFKSTWPVDEGYFNTRYVWAANEFTPQQTMRGKMALYGYLYGLSRTGTNSVISHKSYRSGVNYHAGNATVTRILDCAGRVVWSGKGIISLNQLKQNLPGTNGMYFIQQVQNGETVIKLIVR